MTQGITRREPAVALDREVIARAMFAGWCLGFHLRADWQPDNPLFRTYWLRQADAWIAAEGGR